MFSLARFTGPLTELMVPYTEVMVCLLLVVKGLKKVCRFSWRRHVLQVQCSAANKQTCLRGFSAAPCDAPVRSDPDA